MKFIKIFAIALAAMSVTACSDDDPTFNTDKDAVVEMGEASFTTKEGRGIVTIPLVVKGERNGNVEVTLGINSDAYANPAAINTNLYLTTDNIVIFPEDSTYKVEITIVDDKDMNESRWCNVEILEAKGATVGAQNFTAIEIKDNDSEPYDRAGGEWILQIADLNGAAGSMVINFETYDEGTKGYNKYYKVTGLYSGLSYRAYYAYDEAEGKGTISFNYKEDGALIDEEDTSTTILTLQFLYYDAATGGLYIVNEGETIFHFDNTFSTTELEYTAIPEEYPFWGFISGNSVYNYFYVTGMVRP